MIFKKSSSNLNIYKIGRFLLFDILRFLFYFLSHLIGLVFIIVLIEIKIEWTEGVKFSTPVFYFLTLSTRI